MMINNVRVLGIEFLLPYFEKWSLKPFFKINCSCKQALTFASRPNGHCWPTLDATVECSNLENDFIFVRREIGRGGLPDFSWYNIPKNLPNNHKIYQMTVKYIDQMAVK
jgi:hypothetical protein